MSDLCVSVKGVFRFFFLIWFWTGHRYSLQDKMQSKLNSIFKHYANSVTLYYDISLLYQDVDLVKLALIESDQKQNQPAAVRKF